MKLVLDNALMSFAIVSRMVQDLRDSVAQGDPNDYPRQMQVSS